MKLYNLKNTFPFYFLILFLYHSGKQDNRHSHFHFKDEKTKPKQGLVIYQKSHKCYVI